MKKTEGNLLIVDDNQDVLDALSLFIEDHFKQVYYIKNPNLIPQYLRTKDIDIVLLDMNYSAGINTGNEGLFWMREIIKYDSEIIIIPITAYGEVSTAVKSLKEGAFDFVLKPWDNDKLLSTLNAGYKLRKSKKEVKTLKRQNEILIEETKDKIPELVGNSKIIKDIYGLINKVASTDTNILIQGENGTGKEVISREIYKKSKRNDKAFVSVDLGSLSTNLFESELFGYEKGAFTDAKERKAGRFEIADGGTLFLDEIGNIPLSLQAKLLSAIQNKEIYRIGSTVPVKVDVRLICATNQNLEQMVNKGLFREDLFYRINTIVIDLPPLRSRTEDIPVFAEYFLQKFTSTYNKNNLKITPKALDKLKQHNWPGNIRELEHTIEKAVILADHHLIDTEDFNFRKTGNLNPASTDSLTLVEIEKNAILNALNKHKGNLSEAAKELAISRQTIYNKMTKFGLS